MVTAGGDTSGYVEAKKLFFNAVIGIIIILAVTAVIYTILMTLLRASTDVVDVKTGFFSGVDCGGQTQEDENQIPVLDGAPPPPSGGGQVPTRPTQSVPNLSSDECNNLANGNYIPSTGVCNVPITPDTPPATIDSDYGCDTSSGDNGTIYDCSAGIASCAQAGFGFEVYSGNNRVRCVPTNTQPPQTTPTPNCPDGQVINGICFNNENRPNPINPNPSASQSVDVEYDGGNAGVNTIINDRFPDRDVVLIENVGPGVNLNDNNTKTEYEQNCSQDGQTVVFLLPSNGGSGGYVACLR